MAGSIWKGSISFGLLNIPVNLQKAQEGNDLSFSMLDSKDFSPIKYKKVNAKSGHEVPWARIVKGYEYDSGQYVILNKEDFKAANPKATQT
jgi:DNA end-binding protein Ku